MTIELVPQLEQKLSPIERLEALCESARQSFSPGFSKKSRNGSTNTETW